MPQHVCSFALKSGRTMVVWRGADGWWTAQDVDDRQFQVAASDMDALKDAAERQDRIMQRLRRKEASA